MITYNTTPEKIAEVLSKDLEKSVETAIRQQLQMVATQIVHEAAKDMAKAITAQIKTVKNMDNVEIVLMVDNRKVDSESVRLPIADVSADA